MDGGVSLQKFQASRLGTAFNPYGLAIPTGNRDDWPTLTQRAIAAIRAVKETQSGRSVYLCGESFGGCLALAIAWAEPSLIDRIILVNPASSFNQSAWLGWGATVAPWLSDSLYQVFTFGLLPWLANLDRVPQSNQQALLSAMQSLPAKTVAWRISLLQHFIANAQKLAEIQLPVLAIAGAADRLLPSVEEVQRLVAALPNGRSVILPNSGHSCLLETGIHLGAIARSQGFL